MKKYLITYSLKTKNWDYTAFYNALKNIGSWWHYLDNTWIVKSDLTSQDIYQKIGPKLLSVNDFILIVEIIPDKKSGWLPKDAWDWIDSN